MMQVLLLVVQVRVRVQQVWPGWQVQVQQLELARLRVWWLRVSM